MFSTPGTEFVSARDSRVNGARRFHYCILEKLSFAPIRGDLNIRLNFSEDRITQKICKRANNIPLVKNYLGAR